MQSEMDQNDPSQGTWWAGSTSPREIRASFTSPMAVTGVGLSAQSMGGDEGA
jgi:hypothetical protein